MNRDGWPAHPNPNDGETWRDWCDDLVELKLFSTARAVGGDLGPIGMIGGPRVIIGTRPPSAIVWVERLPWGWPNPRREFLNADSPSVKSYAKNLVEKFRAAAQREFDKREARRGSRRRGDAAVFRELEYRLLMDRANGR